MSLYRRAVIAALICCGGIVVAICVAAWLVARHAAAI